MPERPGVDRLAPSSARDARQVARIGLTDEDEVADVVGVDAEDEEHALVWDL